MYNAHVCVPNGETITDRDLVDWSNEQIEAVIWFAELNRGQRVNTQFRNSGETAKFSGLGQYVEKAKERVTKKYVGNRSPQAEQRTVARGRSVTAARRSPLQQLEWNVLKITVDFRQ